MLDPRVFHEYSVAIDERNCVIRCVHDLDISYRDSRTPFHRDGFWSLSARSVAINGSTALDASVFDAVEPEQRRVEIHGFFVGIWIVGKFLDVVDVVIIARR